MNAILAVGGHIKTAEAISLIEKWFGDIPSGKKYERSIADEPKQNEERRMEVKAGVPLDALYKVWHMDNRLSHGYYVADLITEVMGGGASSRLFQSLVKEQKLFSNIECYHFGSVENGLLTIEGKLVKGTKMEDAERAVNVEIEKLKQDGITEKELEKTKNKTESTLAFEDMSVMNRVNNLAFYELLGDAGLFNNDREKYFAVTREDMQQYSQNIFDVNNSSTLCYYADNGAMN